MFTNRIHNTYNKSNKKSNKSNRSNRSNKGNKKYKYRACVGIMLINNQNMIFVGQRVDCTVQALQMPQGGIETGESYTIAALRELSEEIGTTNVKILYKTKRLYKYNFPLEIRDTIYNGKYCGQKLRWVLMKFTGKDAEININTVHPEFNLWKWIDVSALIENAVSFKKIMYSCVIKEFSKRIISS